ncbi:MAG: L-threonylcarbamoyladenylate synthase [Bacteroidetes bacterium]|nr:L-threonylcarbamoyladenylate synthase [Bacteroidota bacterium]
MPQTRLIRVDSDTPDPSVIDEACRVLSAGGLVAFPTETVYGLGADAMNADAVRSVFAAKGRPADNPLIVHLADASQLGMVARDVPARAMRLAGTFWPGPITLVLPVRPEVPREVTAGLPTVAVRVPDHAVPRQIVQRLGRGLVGPSANLSGRPSPTTGPHVMDDLNGRVDLILDAGPTRIGLESTVVDMTVDPPAILREGGISHDALLTELGAVRTPDDVTLLRRSPGTRHRHYAPAATVVLVPSGDEQRLQRAVDEARASGKMTAVIVHTFELPVVRAHVVVRVAGDERSYAHQLYATLRSLDARGVSVIVVESVPGSGLWRTIADRLRRAAEPPS